VVVLAALFVLVLVYYAAHIAWRTPPRTRPQIFAHRGGARHAPENTLAAFTNAVAQGADALEFDVQMTRDGHLVVIHDPTVDRTTNGTGAVRLLKLAQIRLLDAGGGQQVPGVEQVLQLAKAAGIRILPETKSAHLYPGVEEKLIRALEQADYIDRTVIQSFERASLEKLHRINPNVKLCALYRPWQFDVRAPAAGAQCVAPPGEMVLLNPGIIGQAHRRQREVYVWFARLESPLVVRLVRFFGADGVIVNDVAAARAALAG
jgi:glycerophosphoryl diester phosphodiesterase